MPFGNGGWNPGFKQAKLGGFHAANFIAQSCRFLKFQDWPQRLSYWFQDQQARF